METVAVRINRYVRGVHAAHLATARRIAQSLGVPLAFLYADTDVLAEAILTLDLLSKSKQRKSWPTSRSGWRKRAWSG